MRTAQSPLTVGAKIADAASGTTLAQPGGIPLTYTRTGTGRYTAFFASGFSVLSAVASPDFSVSNTVARVSAGGNSVSTAIDTAGTPTNSSHYITATLQRYGTT
jgi:hypothetical protein